jgi:hypothetical protein
MAEFVRAALDLPAAVFGIALILVLAYWALIAFGVLDVVFGVVVSAAASLFVAVAWFAALAGTLLAHRGHLSGAVPSTGVVLAAVVLSGLVTRVLTPPLRRALTEEQVPSRRDFVGRMCVIRTGRVDLAFGQATVRAADGSSAVIQVRQQRNQEEEAALKAGSTALIFDYDADGGFFWVMPYDAELDPHRPLR